MVEQALWLSIFTLALGSAAADAASDEVSAEVMALAQGDRRAVEAARVHLMVAMADTPATNQTGAALGYLDLALRRGDEARRWSAVSSRLDPWTVAQHRPGRGTRPVA